MHVVTKNFHNEETITLLCGPEDYVLRLIESRCHVSLYLRGTTLTIESNQAERLQKAEKIVGQIYQRIESRRAMLGQAEIFSLVDAIYASDATDPLDPPRRESEHESIRLKTAKGGVVPLSPAQQRYVKAITAFDLTFASGPAGTGKTFVAVAAGVSLMRQRRYEKLILCRPAVEAGGERIGFLPGDIRDKIDPYMQPLIDALKEMTPQDQLNRWLERGSVEITPLAFMRGRTLKNAFIILDEAQNATPVQMKMFLTRLGEGSKMVVCGDEEQSDLPRDIRSGFSQAIRLTKTIEGVGHIFFKSEDVIRHPLVKQIIDAYRTTQAPRAAQTAMEDTDNTL